MRLGLAAAVLLMGCVMKEPAPTTTPPTREPGCAIDPMELDFGEVDADSVSSRQLMLRNQSEWAHQLTVSALEPPFFRANSQSLVLGRFATEALPIFFKPEDALLHLSSLVISEPAPRAGVTPCELTIPLRGLGKGRLTIDPARLEFGVMDPGQTMTKELRLQNARREPVGFMANVLFDFFVDTPPITVEPPNGEIPALGSITLIVTAAPQSATLRSGKVVVEAFPQVLESNFTLQVGKPVAEVSPGELTSWRVGFEPASAPLSFSRHSLIARNVGTSGSVSELALRVGEPAFLIEALQGTYDEIAIDLPSPLFSGLTQDAGVEVGVELRPVSLGPKEFRLRFAWRDPSLPMTEVMVHATAETLPACSMSVQPADVLLLTAMPDGGLEGTVSFTNTGGNLCIVDDVRLGSGTMSGYSIVSGAAQQVEVPRGGSHVVTIAGPPQPTSRRVGLLSHHVFNVNSTAGAVMLQAP